MATIDELTIEVQTESKNANKDIDALSKSLLNLKKSVKGLESIKLDGFKSAMKSISDSAKSLRGMKELSATVKSLKDLSNVSTAAKSLKDLSNVSTAAKSLKDLSNVSTAAKSLDKIKKSANGLKDIKADIDTKDFDTAVGELRERFKNVGTDFVFKGDSSKLEKTINGLETSLDRLYEKEDEMRDLGANVDSRGFIKLQRDISLTSNKLDILRNQMEKIRKASSELPKNFSIDRGDNKSVSAAPEPPRVTTTSAKSLRYDKDAMRAVFGEGAEDIKDFNDAVKKLGENAGTILNGIGNNFGEIGESAKKATESVSGVGGKLKNSFKDAELSVDEFENYLENLQIPDIRTNNLKKLQSELERTEKKLDELTVKSDNWAAKGVNPDSTKFRNLQEQIVATSKKTDALKKKIKEVGETKPNVSGWQKLTALSTLIDKSFGAIKRGVSSALSSIKKLGNGFKSLHSIVKQVSSAIGKMFSNIVQLAGKATSAITSSVKGMTSAFSKLRGESSGVQKISSGIGGLAKVAGGLLAAKGIANFGKEAIELGSNITEVENVVDTAFGSMADKVYNFASTAAEKFGLSELAAKQYSGTMMAMLKSSGVAQGAAADMSVTLAGLAGDLASFYNIDNDTAFQKLRAGISGETEPLKQLGINMNIVNLEAYAMSQGITKAYKDMTLAEQSILRYNYILAKTGDAQGDFARTAGTWANQLRLLKLNIQSISAIIGQGLIAALLPAIKLLNKFMAKLTEVAKKFRDFMYVLFGKKIESPMRGVVDDMAGMTDYTTDLSGISNSTEDIEDGMKEAADGTDDFTSSAKKLQKQLATLSFDELNQLPSKLDNLGDLGTSNKKDKDSNLDDMNIGDMSDMFDDLYDKAEIEPVNKWAEAIRKAFLDHDWEGLGKTIAQMTNAGLRKVYDGIKEITPKVESALRAFAETFNSFVNWLDWDLLGRTIGAGVNLLANSFNALFGSGGINLEKLGKKLSVGFRGLIDEIEWTELGNALGNAFMIPWRIASGFIEDMWRINPDTLLTGWMETGIALADGIHGIFDKISFAKIGKTIADGFNGIIETISSFGEKLKENKTLSMLAISIADGFNNIIDNIDIGKATSEISELALDILKAMNRSAELTHWEDFGYNVAEGLYKIPWLSLFNQVFDLVDATFGESMRGFVGFLAEHASQLGEGFADVFNTLFSKMNYIANKTPWDDIGKGISTFLNASIAKIKPVEAAKSLGNFVTKLLDAMLRVARETNWNDLGVKIGQFLTNIPWATNIGQVFDTITTVFGGLITGLGGTIIEKMPEIGTALSDGFNHAFQKLDEFLSGISWVDIGLYISTGLNNMIQGIDWEAAGETFGTLVKGLIDTIFTVAMNTDWIAFGQGIGDFLDGIPWLEILTEVALGLSAIIGEVLAGLMETTSGKLLLFLGGLWAVVEGFGIGNKALGVVNEFAKNFGLLPEGVTSVVPILAEKIGLITGEGGLLPKIASVAGTVVSKAGGILKTLGTVIFSPTGALIAGIAIGVALIVTHWDEIKEAAGKVKEWVSEKFGQLKDSVKESMKNLGEDVKEGWGRAQEGFYNFDNFLSNVFSHDWSENFGALGDVFNGFNANVSNIWEAIKRTFGGVIDFVAGVFTGDWSRAWQGVRDIFGGIWDGLEAVVKAPVNAIIGILNALISGAAWAVNGIGDMLNGLNVKFPDWTPFGLGGKEIKFNFPTWTPGKLDYLAEGGVLKRGQVGILEGSGAEAVVPLEKNRQWIARVSEEMSRTNYTYSGGGFNSQNIIDAIVEGVVTAMAMNQGNQPPINVNCYAELKTENNEVLARAVAQGQESIDYRMNPTPSYGY